MANSLTDSPNTPYDGLVHIHRKNFRFRIWFAQLLQPGYKTHNRIEPAIQLRQNTGLVDLETAGKMQEESP